MRGTDEQQNHVFSYLSPEQRVRPDHPLRAIRGMVDEVLRQLSRRFDAMYAGVGRPSIAPEKLLRAQLLQLLYSVRSERLLMEEMNYNLLFRWFVGLNADDPVWDATVFTKNRDRLLEADVAREFLALVVAQAEMRGLTSDEHFTVDGTLLEAWASPKSFQPKEGQPPPDDEGGNPTVDFRGQKRSNETHESKTDPDAKLARKGAGKEAKLSYSGNLLVENGQGLIVNAGVYEANGTAERDAALVMSEQIRRGHWITVGGDKGFDTTGFGPSAGICGCDRMWRRITPDRAEPYRSSRPDVMAKLSYNSGIKSQGNVGQICVAVSRDGDYRMVESFNDGNIRRLHGTIPKDEFHQLATLLSERDFRNLSNDQAGLIRQEAQSFAVEIPLGDRSQSTTLDTEGIYYGATYIESQLCGKQDAIVVGGGNSAGQAAVYLSQTASKVHMLVRSGQLSDTMSRYLIQRIEENSAIELHYHTEIVGLDGDTQLERVTWRDSKTGETSTHDIRYVFIMAGGSPRTEWLKGCIAMDNKGFILTGRDLDPVLHDYHWPLPRAPLMLETSQPGVFAVGDVRAGNVKRVASAVGEGSIAISLVHRVLAEI